MNEIEEKIFDKVLSRILDVKRMAKMFNIDKSLVGVEVNPYTFKILCLGIGTVMFLEDAPEGNVKHSYVYGLECSTNENLSYSQVAIVFDSMR